jgi:2-polyprenyl-3-methyl-5-hydroxy-6-metoxy-1,4-benzoquinol methylase/tetratricopeptide (TPR) repeat protein
MRVLFSTGSAASYMAPPRLAEEQVNCGPAWSDQRAPDGRFLSLATPSGQYDLAAIAAKLPADQTPDVVVCLVDASWCNQPRNLGAFKCPRVLLIADTHHLSSPLIGMMQYAISEPFTRRVFLYDRHHAAFFHGAGIRDLHWFPGLSFPHNDASVQAARKAQREHRLAFVGQTGKFHPRRARLLHALEGAGVPVVPQPLPQAQALDYYGASLLGFNASLNGDLNLRVFEILAAGAGLLTDRLSDDSGLGHLFSEGRELATYGSAAELIDRARHYLTHPAEARGLGEAGARWFDERFNERRRRDLFRQLAFDGRSAPEFTFPRAMTTRVFFGGDTGRLLQSLLAYEGLQEQHRTHETVRVALTKTTPADLAALVATLPRARLEREAEGSDLIVFGRSEARRMTTTGVPTLWCWDAQPADVDALTAVFRPSGYAPTSRTPAIWRKSNGSNPTGSDGDLATQARAHLARGAYGSALELGRAALQHDPQSVAALTVLAELALLQREASVAEKLLIRARNLAPHDTSLTSLMAESLLAQKKTAQAEKLLQSAARNTPAAPRILRVLASVREAQGRAAEGIELLESAARQSPIPAEIAAHLGRMLRRNGRILDGLEWQRRALGAGQCIDIVDTYARPVRVAFLAQHPQGWTSLESVWRTLSADPSFKVTVIAAPYQHPYPPEGGSEAIYEFLQKQGVPFVRWDAQPLTPGFADLVFVQNPYDVTRPPPLRTDALVKLVPRLAYVPYGLEIGGGQENAVNQFDLPLQQHAWVVFARSPRHRAMFERHCSVGAGHVAITGHPRLDSLHDLDALPVDDEFRAFARGRRMIFWNPQFDIRPDGTGYSTFLLWQEFLIREFSRRQDLVFVIRPHPLFFSTLEVRKLWSGEQVQDFLRRVQHAGNILIDRRPSYLPVFAASAAMISDASTFLLEYAATGKPLLYLHNPRGPSLNDDGEFIRAHSYTAERAEEISAFLDLVARGEDPRGNARRQAYPEVMHRPPEGVAEAIKHHLLQRLRTEAASAEQRWQEQGRHFWSSCKDTHFGTPAYSARAREELVQRLPRYLDSKDEVVDVGCGNGEMTLLVAPHCGSIVGYDISPALIHQASAAANARSVKNARFAVLDLGRGVPSERADVVLCLEVFACIHDDETWLATLRRFGEILPEGGLLVLRETVSPDQRRKRRHAHGYYACYRSVDEYLGATFAAGFSLLEEVLLDTNSEGCTNRLWVLRHTGRLAATRSIRSHHHTF